jgi:hypothetical protein
VLQRLPARKDLGLSDDLADQLDRRVRDEAEYLRFRHYIHMNPVGRGLVALPQEFPHSSAVMKVDEVPQRLKLAA